MSISNNSQNPERSINTNITKKTQESQSDKPVEKDIKNSASKYSEPAINSSDITIHLDDIPSYFKLEGDIAFDTEAMGLKTRRDRICLLQLCDSNGKACIIKFRRGVSEAPNLKRLFEDPNIAKIAHFARFDIRGMLQQFNIHTNNVQCTHLASTLGRTYTNNHSLKDVCRDMLGINLNKQATFSDWGSEKITNEQLEYAVSDVYYLHKCLEKLTDILKREDRFKLYEALRPGIIARAMLDIAGWEQGDPYSHHRDPARLC